jgi:hypothetical protein
MPHACPRDHVLLSAYPWAVLFLMTTPVVELYSTTCHVDPVKKLMLFKISDPRIDYVQSRLTIRPDVVLHRGICMGSCDVSERRIASEISGLEQDFEVHHVVDDDL